MSALFVRKKEHPDLKIKVDNQHVIRNIIGFDPEEIIE